LLGIVPFDFVAQQRPAVFFQILIGYFLPPGLDGKMGLPQRHDFFGWIGVLNHKATGIPRKQDGLYRPVSALADFDHIGDINEMIVHAPAAVETSHTRLTDNGLEIPVIIVSKNGNRSRCCFNSLPLDGLRHAHIFFGIHFKSQGNCEIFSAARCFDVFQFGPRTQQPQRG
jgi:hypothetical protein